ncbi:MAG: DUF1206 domain-containing protein [Gemmatimonadaceae bacterium]
MNWIEGLAKAGFAAKGFVYIAIGVLSTQVALGSRGKIADSSSALRTIYGQPFGRATLMLVGVGLLGYALWRLVEAITDPERKGASPKRIAIRVSYVVRAITHGALGIEALRLLSGTKVSGADRTEHWTARLMAAPLGTSLVMAVGAGILGFGAFQLYHAMTYRSASELRLSGLNPETARWVVPVSRFGIAARGVVFGIIGYFLIRAGLQHDPSEASGMRESFRTLLTQPRGHWLLGIVAIGFIAYGIYQFLQVRYRRITVA